MNQNNSSIVLLLLTFIFTGCAPMPVEVSSNSAFDIKKHKTYNIVANTQDDLINLPLEKSNIDRIVTETIGSQLTDKGYQLSSDKPEMLISYYLVTNAKTDIFLVNQYYGDMGFRQPPGRSSTRDFQNLQQVTYEEGILIIDIIDAATNQRVWQGHVTSRSDLYKDKQRKEQRLQKGVNKILSYLPSASKK